jgi:hypothetical protein
MVRLVKSGFYMLRTWVGGTLLVLAFQVFPRDLREHVVVELSQKLQRSKVWKKLKQSMH